MKTTYTISIFTEDKIGLLSRVTIIFTRRHINIESLTVCESEVKGISRYTIVVTVLPEQVEKLVKQLEKQVEVLKAFCHVNSEIISSEIALYKVSAEALKENELFMRIVNENYSKILSIAPDYIVVEKTGDEREIKKLFSDLERFGILEFVRSGRVSITKPLKTLHEFLVELENNSKITIKHFNK
jgi:acetolactate synthase-1/3 small subunit